MHLRCDETPQWSLLRQHFETAGRCLDLRQAFAADAQRFAHFSQSAPHVFADLSKNLWDRPAEALLLDMGRQCGIESQRHAMLRGETINGTEQRAVLHTLLRRPPGLALPGDLPCVAPDLVQVHATLDAMLAFAETVRADEGITDVEAARALGITTTFGFWDWVGGRYSLWSAIGLPVAIAVGAEGFRSLLGGAHAMDEHFRTAPLASNLPVRLGLLDVWYRNFHGFNNRCVAPYHAGLRRLPAYLQQLEMESNGKRVDRQGRVLPLEIVAVRQRAHPLAGHHQMLLANALAQSQALMVGRPSTDGHRHCPGNRPSTFPLLDALAPASLGALIALQEHRVFVSGCLWGINSFDQWGVELGKGLARDLELRLASGDATGLDASTAGLLQRLRG